MALEFPEHVISSDERCDGCGYNLKTLSATGRCPECGLSISESRRRSRLSAVELIAVASIPVIGIGQLFGPVLSGFGVSGCIRLFLACGLINFVLADFLLLRRVSLEHKQKTRKLLLVSIVFAMMFVGISMLATVAVRTAADI